MRVTIRDFGQLTQLCVLWPPQARNSRRIKRCRVFVLISADYDTRRVDRRRELGSLVQCAPSGLQPRFVDMGFESCPEGNFLEAKAALHFGSGKLHVLVPAWPGKSAQFCKMAVYF